MEIPEARLYKGRAAALHLTVQTDLSLNLEKNSRNAEMFQVVLLPHEFEMLLDALRPDLQVQSQLANLGTC